MRTLQVLKELYELEPAAHGRFALRRKKREAKASNVPIVAVSLPKLYYKYYVI